MKVSRLRRKIPKRFGIFPTLDPTCLYRVACLPAKCCKDLTPATKLTDPKTGETKPLKEMSRRQLDRALDKLEGKTSPSVPGVMRWLPARLPSGGRGVG